MEDFYTISEAKNKLTSLIHRVEKGPAIKLTRHGRPVAVLLSLREYESISRKSRGFWRELSDLRKWMKRQEIVLCDEDFEMLRNHSSGRRVELDGSDR